jgi:hypothetical protein
MGDKKKHDDSLLDTVLTGCERYINPYTDFGFKKLFGTEMNKDLLISFLNALLDIGKNKITDVQYLNSESLGAGLDDLHVKCERLEKALRKDDPRGTIAAARDLRSTVDALEGLVDDSRWPLPKYREMLFIC